MANQRDLSGAGRSDGESAGAGPGPAEIPAPAGGGLRRVVADYITLTKPPIILMLLVTAVGGMFLAQRAVYGGGVPDWLTLLLVCAGGGLGAGGANAINHYLDQDIDALMTRTARRPVPGHRVRPRMALAFGVGLNAASFAVLLLGVNLLAAALTLSASLFYVLVYTLWLKRSTPQNIVIGGAAGSIPPAVGWVAVAGSFDLPALYMFAIVFFWTPPHFWALSLLIQGDYERAGVPMLPVVAGPQRTAENILAYSLALAALALAFTATGAAGGIYLGAAAILGAGFVWGAWRLFREQTRPRARWLYLYSLLYLALLFGAMMADGVYRVL